MSKSTTSLTIKILASVGAALYLLFIAMTLFFDSYPIFNPFDLKESNPKIYLGLNFLAKYYFEVLQLHYYPFNPIF